jgi:hypothetical protein
MSEKAFRICVVALLAIIALQLGIGGSASDSISSAWIYARNIGKVKEEPAPSPPSQRGGILDAHSDTLIEAAKQTPIIKPKP